MQNEYLDEILKLQQKEWLNPDEVESLYGFKKATQAKWRVQKRIPYHKIGSYIKYNHNELRTWMQNDGGKDKIFECFENMNCGSCKHLGAANVCTCENSPWFDYRVCQEGEEGMVCCKFFEETPNA